MRHPAVRAALLSLFVLALSALGATAAAAATGTGPRETIDQSFTTTRPGAPTGIDYTGVYHAAGNPKGNPPFMRRMVFYPPAGMHYDTRVPARCSAPDIELQALGPGACPAGSRLGGGTVEGLILMPFNHGVVFDHYRHTIDVMNNANQQIILVKAEGYAVVRGQIRPDGSIDFPLAACFPEPPTGCVDDYVIGLKTLSRLAPYTKTSGGRVRSYATTPAKCPARGYWRSAVRFWWSDGSVDKVVTKEPCKRPHKRARHRR
jgi:hypothetical protein